MALRPGYVVREVAASLRRHALVSFAAVSTAFIALFLLGGALLIDRQVGLVVEATTVKVEVAVFIRDEITPQERSYLNRQLASMPEVATVEY